MKPILIIAQRELRTFFDSLIAYIIIVLFLAITGFFTWIYGFGNEVFFSGQASIQSFFFFAYFTLLFFIPALTMRTFAEEKKTGTIELLLTKAVTDRQIVIGKFLACLALVLIALVFSLPYYFTIAWLGPVDHGAVWCGYIGIILLSAAYISVGLYASSLQSDQIVAFLMTLCIGVVLFLFTWILTTYIFGTAGRILEYLNAYTHYESLSRGVLDSKSVIYFVSISVLFLVLAETNLMKRNVVS